MATKERLQFSEIKFPQDVYGFTSGLKKELQMCAGKVGSDKDKLQLLRDTFNLYYAYIKQNLDDNLKTIQDSIKAAQAEQESTADTAEAATNE